jgi:hypothetical protein
MRSGPKGGWLHGYFSFTARCAFVPCWSNPFPDRAVFSLIMDIMDKTEQQALQVTKEIMVKFIEVGRISPTNFSEYFAIIYDEVLATVTRTRDDADIPEIGSTE